MTVLHRDRRGTTMMELMTICGLISILSAVAVPNWLNYLPKMRAQSAVRSAASTLRQARSLSVSEKSRYGVFFDANSESFVLFNDVVNPGAGTYDTGDTLITRTEFGSNVALGTTTLAGSTVVFDMNGAASQSGTVTFTTSDASLSYTIDILASTGRIKTTAG